MTLRAEISDLPPKMREQAERQLGKQEPSPKPNKHGAIRREVDGINFDSIKEADRYCEICLMRDAGEINWFIRQPRFDLPGKRVTYKADFLIVWADGTVTVEDVKSDHTKTLPMYRLKVKQVKEIHGVEVVEV